MKKITRIIVSIFLWIAGLLWLIPVTSIISVIQSFVPSDRIDWLTRIYCRVQVLLTGSRWKAVVHPDVDPNKTYVFAQNHTNHFDHVVMYNSTSHFKQGLELETHFRYPFYGWFMKSRGTIPVPADRNRRTEAVLEGMRNEVQKGRSILAFPEGTRTLDGHVGEFKTGVFFAAQKLGLEIVPVAVSGTFNMMKKGSLLIHPGNTLTVFIEKPVSLEGKSTDEIKKIAEEIRLLIQKRISAHEP